MGGRGAGEFVSVDYRIPTQFEVADHGIDRVDVEVARDVPRVRVVVVISQADRRRRRGRVKHDFPGVAGPVDGVAEPPLACTLEDNGAAHCGRVEAMPISDYGGGLDVEGVLLSDDEVVEL